MAMAEWEKVGAPPFWSLSLQGRCPWAPTALALAWGAYSGSPSLNVVNQVSGL